MVVKKYSVALVIDSMLTKGLEKFARHKSEYIFLCVCEKPTYLSKVNNMSLNLNDYEEKSEKNAYLLLNYKCCYA